MLIQSSITSNNSDQTISIGHNLGRQLPINSIICLKGDLAAGKTTIIKGIASSISGCSPNIVNSPTFIYLNIYEGETPVYHFDLYRLQDADEFLAMGFDDFFQQNGICCIEWSERINNILPPNIITLQLTHQGENKRSITLSYDDSHGKKISL